MLVTTRSNTMTSSFGHGAQQTPELQSEYAFADTTPQREVRAEGEFLAGRAYTESYLRSTFIRLAREFNVDFQLHVAGKRLFSVRYVLIVEVPEDAVRSFIKAAHATLR